MTSQDINQLIEKLAAGEASPAEIQALEAWYRSVYQQREVVWPAGDPNESAAVQARILAQLEAKLKAGGAIAAADGLRDAEGIRAAEDRPADVSRVVEMPRRGGSGRVWLRVAACLVLVAAVWLVARQFVPAREQWLTVENPSGVVRVLDLPDHSRVWLNAGTVFQYDADFLNRRSIRLKGEAYFDVTEDKAHPFIVQAGALQTTVLGTRFDVRSFDEEFEHTITVLQGKVQVADEGKVLDVLTAARQLQWDRDKHVFQTETVDTVDVVAWQQGRLKFNGETMDKVAGTLGRWYKMNFVFRDSAVRNCRLIGEFRSDVSLKTALDLLNTVLDIKYIIDDKQKIVTLYGKGCTPSPK